MINICDVINPDKKYYIYGTAGFAQYCFAKLTQRFGNDIVLGFIETIPKVDKCCGKSIYSVNETDNTASVIITGFKSEELMRTNLVECGFVKENIIAFPELKAYFYKEYKSYIKQVCFWPPIKKYNKDLSDKISWFLPDRITVKVWTDDSETIASFNENVEICDLNDVDKIMVESDYICVWDSENDDGIPLKSHFLRTSTFT